jgi:superfamily I DNA and/or RNA helicase
VREARLVADARAVLTTLSGAYFSSALDGQRFDVVLVDEASMAVLPSLFYAACLAREKTLMVGDPRQLPPIVQSSSPYVQRAMGRSIFEVRVSDPERSDVVVMLDTQYRMHPEIGELVSRLFYSGRLQHGRGTETRAAIAERAPYPGRALVVVDTQGKTRCTTRPGSFSRINEQSAALCAQLAADAVAGGIASIAVITPYADQAREIRKQLDRLGTDTSQVECSTVHRFQGHERDMVIFDTVDAPPLRPGVLLSGRGEGSQAAKLINVSLSRARGKLVVVSDVEHFCEAAPGSLINALNAAGFRAPSHAAR